jgi:Protein of unknown function (DUF3572)
VVDKPLPNADQVSDKLGANRLRIGKDMRGGNATTRERGRRAAAEATAIAALAWLAAEPERLAGFLGETGFDPAAIRQAAADPAFLTGVLSYVAADDDRIVGFAAEQGMKPEAVMRDLAALGGVWERDTP